MTEDDLLTLLTDSRQAGIFPMPASGHAAVRARAEGAGFACFEVSFAACEEIDSVLDQLGDDLAFPAWYGRNLDALNDCLTDFSWREAAGYVLLISGSERLHAERPAVLDAVNEVFATAIDEWRMRGVPMWVFYDAYVRSTTLPDST
ncbi:MAG: barstar family protein [Candidatus Accumulibacter sp. UW25]|jgi:hypothetical protein